VPVAAAEQLLDVLPVPQVLAAPAPLELLDEPVAPPAPDEPGAPDPPAPDDDVVAPLVPLVELLLLAPPLLEEVLLPVGVQHSSLAGPGQ